MKMDVEDSCGIKIKEEVMECLSPSSTTHSICLTGANNPLNNTTIIRNTPTSKLMPMTNNNPEPSPVNLNLKPRSRGGNQQFKDRLPEESAPPSTTDTRTTSPGSQRASTQSSNISRSTVMHDAGRTGGSRSPDSDSPLPQPIKVENSEMIVGKIVKVNQVVHEETSEPNTNGIGPSTPSANRIPHAKFKRLVGTLLQFASDISADTENTVRSLVFSLLTGAMTAEEFQSALQEATNFPLKEFVLPYLKRTLPALQRDLTNVARANNQTLVQYLRLNEAAVLEASDFVPEEGDEVFGEWHNAGAGSGCAFSTCNIPSTGSTNTNNSSNNTGTHNNAAGTTPPIHGGNQHPGSNSVHHYPGPPPPPPPPSSHSLKRRASDTPYYENGTGPLFDDGPSYGKRSINPWASHHRVHQQREQREQQQQQRQEQQPHQPQQPDPYCWYHPLHLQGGNQPSVQSHPQPSLPSSLVQINHLAVSSTISSARHLVRQQPWSMGGNQRISRLQNGADPNDEWTNIQQMLKCTMGMVEQTRVAVDILQQRAIPGTAIPPVPVTTSGTNYQNNVPAINTSPQSDTTGSERDSNFKRISEEIVAHSIRNTEDRIAEVQRRAEEAMLETKRAAVAEVQQAIIEAVAKSRAADSLRVHHRLYEQPMQRSHRHLIGHGHGHGHGHGSLHRVLDTTTSSTTTATTTTTTTTARNTIAAREEDKELQPVTESSCWNCGRLALETCTGCGIAWYCSSFCQRRDWETGGHHIKCNPRRPTPPPPRSLPPTPLPRSTSRSPTASNPGGGITRGTSSSSSNSVGGIPTGHNVKRK